MAQLKVFFGVSAFNSMLSEDKGARKLLEMAFDRSINILTCPFVIRSVLSTLAVVVPDEHPGEYPLRSHLRILFQENNNVFEFVEPNRNKIKQLRRDHKMSGPHAVKVASILKCKPHFFATQNEAFLNHYHNLIVQEGKAQVHKPEVVYAAILRQYRTIE